MLPPKSLLIPGPWTVRGNTVLDANGKTIAVCFARNATAHAYWIAEIPNLTDRLDEAGTPETTNEIEALEARIARLESDLENSEDARSAAEIEAEDLREEVRSLTETVETLKRRGLAGK